MIPILLSHPIPQPTGANLQQQLEQHDTIIRSSRKLNSNGGYNSAQVSPSIVVIIIVLTIIFFLSAFLHLLIRWLARNPRGVGRGPNSRSIVTLTALQGQLQQLFHMHDSGIEQALIDALPVFVYKSVMPGLKDGADCAICLCEFQTDDHLRLLPSCSHAFHMDCIDTWLLSHSTCPLCRSALQPECWMQNVPSSTSPTVEDDDGGPGGGAVLDNSSRRRSSSNSMMMTTIRSAPHDRGACEENHAASRRSLSSQPADDVRPCTEDYCAGLNAVDPGCHSQRSVGNISIAFTEGGAALSVNEELSERTSSTLGSGRRVSVQLGKCRLIKPGQHPPSSNKGGASRRSYSKGSYEYVVNPLSVEIVVPTNMSYNKVIANSRRIDLGHRATASAECLEAPVADPHRCDSPPYSENMSSCWASASFRRLRNADEKAETSSQVDQSAHWITLDLTNSSTGTSMRGNVGSDVIMSPETNDSKELDAGTCKVDHQKTPSKRAVSFRLPTPSAGSMVAKLRASGSRRALSENEAFSFWESSSDLALDNGQLTLTMDNTVEHRSSSFARRTMDWIVGWQKRTVHPHDISSSEVDLPHV